MPCTGVDWFGEAVVSAGVGVSVQLWRGTFRPPQVQTIGKLLVYIEVYNPNISLNNACITLDNRTKVAERVGFEPTIPGRYTGFRDRRFRPLSHLSAQLNRGTFVRFWTIAPIKL